MSDDRDLALGALRNIVDKERDPTIRHRAAVALLKWSQSATVRYEPLPTLSITSSDEALSWRGVVIAVVLIASLTAIGITILVTA